MSESKRVNALIAMADDTERLDWLEEYIRDQGGLLLHDGSGTGLPRMQYAGLAFREGFRSLREALDCARGITDEKPVDMRMLLVRVVAEKALPFDVKIPNATTVKAMRAADAACRALQPRRIAMKCHFTVSK